MVYLNEIIRFLFLKKKRLPGVGSEPGASRFHFFSHFHHFTAEPQRLQIIRFLEFPSLRVIYTKSNISPILAVRLIETELSRPKSDRFLMLV
jgi:hypothetical protein